MSNDGRMEDVSALLYAAPILGAVVYALYLWVRTGTSVFLPSSVYLTVTRDPTLFILGSFAVMLGVIVEVTSAEPSSRPGKLVSLSGMLQSVAIASLVLVILSALYANSFVNLGGAASDLLVGRFGLVFPATLFLLSYLLAARFRWASIFDRRVLGIVALILVPATLYGLGRRQTGLGLGISFVLMVVGLAFLLIPSKAAQAKTQ